MVKVARSAGFCWGVKRAVNLAVEASKSGKVYCLGELIHNRLEIERLKSFGIEFVESVESLERGETIIIRSHGIPPKTMKRIGEKGLKAVDATCPFVKDVHEKAVRLEEEKYPVCILGNPNHPEVIGIAGHVKEPLIVNSIDELEDFPKMDRLGVVCQTTLEQEFLKRAVAILVEKVKDLKVFNTICRATQIRQDEARKLSSEVDLMIVIGGRNSSNTTKLYRISKSVNPKTYHVESAEEIKDSWFNGVKSVGVTAGASTPRWVIDEVVKRVREIVEGGELVGRGVCKAT